MKHTSDNRKLRFMLKCTQHMYVYVYVSMGYMCVRAVYESIAYESRAKAVIANISGVFET